MNAWTFCLASASVVALGCDAVVPRGRLDAASDARLDAPLDSRLVTASDDDGDTISNMHEGDGSVDYDGDGLPDSRDIDSDDDGLSDQDEAGDTDPSTFPIDTDRDGRPDFRDRDSDGDGLPDRDDRSAGTSPTDSDADGDGASDLVEVAAGTDPLLATSNPTARGDFVFLSPFESAPLPPRATLVFETSIRKADVFFMIDTSVSMLEYIETIRASLSTTIVPGVLEAIPDVQFGVGNFDKCPSSSFMPGTCDGINAVRTSTADVPSVLTGLASLTADCVNVHEPYAQSVWLWATGDTSRWPRVIRPACGSGVGLGCMRSDAIPILVLVGDEPFSESYNVMGPSCASSGCASCASFPNVTTVATAVRAMRGRVVVLGSTASSSEWGRILDETGSYGRMGARLAFPDAGSADVDRAVVSAIRDLAANTPLDVSAVFRDDPSDALDTSMLVDRIEANTTGGVADPRDPTRICMGGLPATDTDSDGVADTFPRVVERTPVCFDLFAATNTTVAPRPEAQLLRGYVDVIGDGLTVLDTRQVYFLVPPRIEEGPIL